MSRPPRRKHRLGPFHWAVLAVWFVVAGWLLVSISVSLVDALFFGDGPVVRSGEVTAPDAAPDEAAAPRPPTGP